MKKAALIIVLLLLVLFSGCIRAKTPSANVNASPEPSAVIRLPAPALKGEVSLEETLVNRRSAREYAATPLSLGNISQLLWAAQGITAQWGGRTAPSAGGIYPLEVYLVTGNAEGLTPGVYQYRPAGHDIVKIKDGDMRENLARAALDQTWVKDGAIDIVITAVYARTTGKYGSRGQRYADMEAGHAAQNICLQATALNLGLVTVGAFSDERVTGLLGIPASEVPLYIIPVGRKG
jgi:SagB-type dehydrogenase family enzyme